MRLLIIGPESKRHLLEVHSVRALTSGQNDALEVVLGKDSQLYSTLYVLSPDQNSVIILEELLKHDYAKVNVMKLLYRAYDGGPFKTADQLRG